MQKCVTNEKIMLEFQRRKTHIINETHGSMGWLDFWAHQRSLTVVYHEQSIIPQDVDNRARSSLALMRLSFMG